MPLHETLGWPGVTQKVFAALALQDRQHLLDIDLHSGRQPKDDFLDPGGRSTGLEFRHDQVGRRQPLDAIDLLEHRVGIKADNHGILALDVDLDGVRLAGDVLDTTLGLFCLGRRRRHQRCGEHP